MDIITTTIIMTTPRSSKRDYVIGKDLKPHNCLIETCNVTQATTEVMTTTSTHLWRLSTTPQPTQTDIPTNQNLQDTIPMFFSDVPMICQVGFSIRNPLQRMI